MGELDFVSKVTGRRLGGRAGGCVGKKGGLYTKSALFLVHPFSAGANKGEGGQINSSMQPIRVT